MPPAQEDCQSSEKLFDRFTCQDFLFFNLAFYVGPKYFLVDQSSPRLSRQHIMPPSSIHDATKLFITKELVVCIGLWCLFCAGMGAVSYYTGLPLEF